VWRKARSESLRECSEFVVHDSEALLACIVDRSACEWRESGAEHDAGIE
jgi:hypothetical protein